MASRLRAEIETGDPIGRLVIPAIDLNIVAVEGTETTTRTDANGAFTIDARKGESSLDYSVRDPIVVAKRDGKLAYPAERLARLQQELLESRLRMMEEGNYVYRPAPGGERPQRYVF